MQTLWSSYIHSLPIIVCNELNACTTLPVAFMDHVPAAATVYTFLVWYVRMCLHAADLNCLEMFARNLVPGWTSWGNEVLKFQQTS